MSTPRKRGTAPSIGPATASEAVAAPSVGVAIISHNYGRYLEDAIRSVLSQSLYPDFVLVIDDDSSDDTAEIASQYAEYGVQYVKVNNRCVWTNRLLASRIIPSKWLLCLDADNTLQADYLRQAIALGESDSRCGIVYPSLHCFGESSRVLDLSSPLKHISIENFADAASVYRREAIAQSGRLEREIFPENTAEDWVLARSLVADGWVALHNPVPVNYRVHNSNKHARRIKVYYHAAGLSSEQVTIIVPLCGRSDLWRVTSSWLDLQLWPRDQSKVVLIDNSHSVTFGMTIREWIKGSGYDDVHYIRNRRGRKGIADEQRTGRPDHDREVHQLVAGIYNQAFRGLSTDYALTLEDDIDPPLDAVECMMRSMDSSTAAVSGAYLHRDGSRWLAWQGPFLNRTAVTEQQTGCQDISGGGFGCLLVRVPVIEQIRLSTDGPTPFYDSNTFDEIGKLGWKVKLNWDVKCRHIAGPL
jgi:glycosyltransferase involved in cell wall biosynthesis